MKYNKPVICLASLAASIVLLSAANGAIAEERKAATAQEGAIAKERPFFRIEPRKDSAALAQRPRSLECRGPMSHVMDVSNENVLTTSAIYGSNPGGGEGGQFDRTPVLSAKVDLSECTCLDAHLSAMLGSKQTYGPWFGVSSLTLFQVSLTRISGGGPQHMVGHYETPYGVPSPAVALEAERDVDMLGSNFFQKVGNGPHEVPPGTYRVDVWWAGAPPSAPPGGAIGAAFVLKLYTD